MSCAVKRRTVLQGIAGATTLMGSTLFTSGIRAEEGWDAGQVAHVLPTVSDRELLLKVSFRDALGAAPRLRVGGSIVEGRKSDTAGRFWRFHASELAPGTSHRLELVDGAGKLMADPWSIRTAPAPDAEARSVRLLVFTCAGGDDRLAMKDGTRMFLSVRERRELLKRGLSFDPDAVIAIGDHVYWDQESGKLRAFSREAFLELYKTTGTLDHAKPAIGTSNEDSLIKVGEAQIASLYGGLLRSTPVYMLTDDHDLFENDDATDTLMTFPPEQFMFDFARATQRLFYPEFLGDGARPSFLPGVGVFGDAPTLSESFGTLRWGKLLELLLYDTKRYADLKGPTARMAPAHVEAWLLDRTKAADTRQLIHIPSGPIGWAAGKWLEWYPDVLQADGSLGIEKTKPYWQPGWWSQHQRLLAALHGNRDRAPVVVSGDLHASMAGALRRSGSMDLRGNPVNLLCAGTLGSGPMAFPSFARGTGPQRSSQLDVAEALPPTEKNGFTILDVTPDSIGVRMFAWRPPEPFEAIRNLQPIHSAVIQRAA
ncbi:MAG: hypothetical protein AB7O49_00120 [Sphingomonadales bacterium]